jgi:hypothetical protein
MDWLILILGVPAIHSAGAAFRIRRMPLCGHLHRRLGLPERDGMHQWSVSCRRRGQPPAFPPQNLAAIALDDHSVSLTWTSADPAGTEFRIERMEDDGERFETILDDVPSTSATDTSGSEGVTYLYRVRALLDGEVSAPSDIASATTFTVAFTGTLTDDAPDHEGFCGVQRFSRKL